MINNEMETVALLSYDSTIDGYGQVRKGSATSTNIKAFVKLYSQNSTSDPRYIDVELILLTKAIVTTQNMIQYNSVKYDIVRVTPSRRYNEVLCKKAQ